MKEMCIYSFNYIQVQQPTQKINVKLALVGLCIYSNTPKLNVKLTLVGLCITNGLKVRY